MKRLLFKLTGGRPMIDEGFAFTDRVAKRPVHYFRDRLGRRWLKEPAWWRGFRTPAA